MTVMVAWDGNATPMHRHEKTMRRPWDGPGATVGLLLWDDHGTAIFTFHCHNFMAPPRDYHGYSSDRHDVS